MLHLVIINRLNRGALKDLFVIILVVGTLAVGTAHPASAFWRKNSCNPIRLANHDFSSDIEWQPPASFKVKITSAFNTWTAVAAWNGGSQYSYGGNTWLMEWEALTGNFTDYNAVTTCFNRTITFNRAKLPEYQLGTLDIRSVATHEWGHALGLSHTGKHDNHDGNVPTMATCLSGPEANTRSTIEKDDMAAAGWRYDRNSTWGATTATTSFEEASQVDVWERLGSTTLKATPPGVTGGIPSSGHYKELDGRIRQTVRVAEGWKGNYRVAAAFRMRNGTDTGYAIVSGYASHVDYVDVPVGTCEWPHASSNLGGSPQDLNLPPAIGSRHHYVSVTCYPVASGWTECTSGSGLIVQPDHYPDAIDVEITIQEFMKDASGSPYVGVDLDRARAQVEL